MSRAAAYEEREAADGLACRLQLPGGAVRTLEDERPNGAPREALEEVARLGAPDLLVRVHDDDGRHVRLDAVLREGAESEHDLDEAALHVVHARTADDAVLGPEADLLDASERPDGVGMPDEELVRSASPAHARSCVENAAGADPAEATDVQRGLLELLPEDPERSVLRLGNRGRRLGSGQPDEEVDHLRLALPEPGVQLACAGRAHRHGRKSCGNGKDNVSSIEANRPGVT
jgi:hypothetical protein